MAWDDPSPLKRARPAMRNSLAAGDAGGNMSFLDLLKFVAGALICGGFAYAGVHAMVAAWERAHPPRHPMAEIAMPLIVAAIVAFLVLRFVVRRSRDVGGRRSWNEDSTTFGQEVAADVVSAAIDAAFD